MSEDKKEPWLNYLALTTVLLALCATLAAYKGGGYSTSSMLNQVQSSDQWSFYQSKSIKGYLYELQRDQLKLDLKARAATLTPELAAEHQARIDAYTAKVKKYEEEKAAIEKLARTKETARDEALMYGRQFGRSVIFLQIAILLSSIAALMKKKPVWVLGLLTGLAGLFYFANGFWLFLR
jgi:hypothetical protein